MSHLMIPGDRVRVTAGDWCGETGTVFATTRSTRSWALVELDGGGTISTTLERLEAA